MNWFMYWFISDTVSGLVPRAPSSFLEPSFSSSRMTRTIHRRLVLIRFVLDDGHVHGNAKRPRIVHAYRPHVNVQHQIWGAHLFPSN